MRAPEGVEGRTAHAQLTALIILNTGAGEK